MGDFGKGTKRTGADCFAGDKLSSHERVGRFRVFDPIFNGGHFVEGVGPFAAGTVRHAGSHEEARPAVCGASAALCGDLKRLVKFDAGFGRDLLVGPTMVDDELAAVLREGGKIRFERDDAFCCFIGERRVAIDVKCPPIPTQIFEDDPAEIVEKKSGWLRAASKTPPAKFRAGFEARK